MAVVGTVIMFSAAGCVAPPASINDTCGADVTVQLNHWVASQSPGILGSTSVETVGEQRPVPRAMERARPSHREVTERPAGRDVVSAELVMTEFVQVVVSSALSGSRSYWAD